MDISPSDIRCCILIRGTRSSTTREMIQNYCEKYGQMNYSRCAFGPQGIVRGYDVVYKQEQSVNRFMDNRPHHIDGQSVKVKRGIPRHEEPRLTAQIVLTTSDSSTDKQIFQEETLRDYFAKYGSIHACRIDTHHSRPCAYLTFADYDRVDQLINDKPHLINKVPLCIRKHISNDRQTPTKRRAYSSEYSRPKRRRSPSKKQKANVEKKLPQMENTNESFIPSSESIKAEYDRLNTQLENLRGEENAELLDRLEIDVENLLHRIQELQQRKKNFLDRLFNKYTVEYILTLNENDINQRIEQLEQENQLLLLIKQNMPMSNSS